jgi:hypothetical protein
VTYGICPECEQGKHGNCNSEAWDDVKDEPMPCICASKEHQ